MQIDKFVVAKTRGRLAYLVFYCGYRIFVNIGTIIISKMDRAGGVKTRVCLIFLTYLHVVINAL